MRRASCVLFDGAQPRYAYGAYETARILNQRNMAAGADRMEAFNMVMILLRFVDPDAGNDALCRVHRELYTYFSISLLCNFANAVNADNIERLALASQSPTRAKIKGINPCCARPECPNLNALVVSGRDPEKTLEAYIIHGACPSPQLPDALIAETIYDAEPSGQTLSTEELISQAERPQRLNLAGLAKRELGNNITQDKPQSGRLVAVSFEYKGTIQKSIGFFIRDHIRLKDGNDSSKYVIELVGGDGLSKKCKVDPRKSTVVPL